MSDEQPPSVIPSLSPLSCHCAVQPIWLVLSLHTIQHYDWALLTLSRKLSSYVLVGFSAKQWRSTGIFTKRISSRCIKSRKEMENELYPIQIPPPICSKHMSLSTLLTQEVELYADTSHVPIAQRIYCI